MTRAPKVLLLADRRRSQTTKALEKAGYRLLTTYSPDHAVAICVGQHGIDSVVLDQDLFVQTDGWSVAQTLKMVCPSVFVVLIVRGKLLGSTLPDGVDAVVSENDPDNLIGAIQRINAC